MGRKEYAKPRRKRVKNLPQVTKNEREFADKIATPWRDALVNRPKKPHEVAPHDCRIERREYINQRGELVFVEHRR